MGGNRAPVIACWMVFTIGLVSASLAKPRKHGSSIGDSALLCCDVHVPATSPEPNVCDAGGDDASCIKSPMSLFRMPGGKANTTSPNSCVRSSSP